MITSNQASVLFKDNISIEDIIDSIPRDNHYTFMSRMGLENKEYQLVLKAFLKFISIQSILGESNFIPVNHKVDNLWHEFILQTSFYRQFCFSLSGKRFIEHQSIGFNDYTEKESLGEVESLTHVMLWLGLHYGYFGEFSEADMGLWTAVDFLNREMNYSLEDINEAAKNVYVDIVDQVEKLNG